MKIELKNIKHAAFASQETNCFEADIYLDGIKSMKVENSGHGGSDMHREIVKGSYKKLADYCKTLPKHVESFGEYDQTPETIVGDLLNAALAQKRLNAAAKRLCNKMNKGVTLVTFKSKAGIWELGFNWNPLFQKSLREKKPDIDVILNAIPFDDALEMCRTQLNSEVAK